MIYDTRISEEFSETKVFSETTAVLALIGIRIVLDIFGDMYVLEFFRLL